MRLCGGQSETLLDRLIGRKEAESGESSARVAEFGKVQQNLV